MVDLEQLVQGTSTGTLCRIATATKANVRIVCISLESRGYINRAWAGVICNPQMIWRISNDALQRLFQEQKSLRYLRSNSLSETPMKTSTILGKSAAYWLTPPDKAFAEMNSYARGSHKKNTARSRGRLRKKKHSRRAFP